MFLAVPVATMILFMWHFFDIHYILNNSISLGSLTGKVCAFRGSGLGHALPDVAVSILLQIEYICYIAYKHVQVSVLQLQHETFPLAVSVDTFNTSSNLSSSANSSDTVAFRQVTYASMPLSMSVSAANTYRCVLIKSHTC